MKKVITPKPVDAPEPESELKQILAHLAELQAKPATAPVVHVAHPTGPLIVEIERDDQGRMKRLIIERGTTKH